MVRRSRYDRQSTCATGRIKIRNEIIKKKKTKQIRAHVRQSPKRVTVAKFCVKITVMLFDEEILHVLLPKKQDNRLKMQR